MHRLIVITTAKLIINVFYEILFFILKSIKFKNQ